MTAGAAAFFDGASSRRQPVELRLEPDGIAISGEGRAALAFWRYADLRQADASRGLLRLAAAGAPELARLEIADPALSAAVLERCPGLARRRERSEAGAGRIVFWSLAAVASLVLTVVFLVPLVADRLAPLVPIPVERRLGEAVDSQVRLIFGAERCDGEAGVAALETLRAKLSGVADLPMPVSIAVLPSDVPNAFALPGGNIYILSTLLRDAESVDELAGVLAHEMGHVAGRDGLRKLLQIGGSSFLLGLLFGDITGGGAIVLASQVLVDSRYSRRAESAADAFGAGLMLDLGRSPRPLGVFLQRLAGDDDGRLAFLLSHPVSSERLRRLEALDRPESGGPLLDDGEWQALKSICDKPS